VNFEEGYKTHSSSFRTIIYKVGSSFFRASFPKYELVEATSNAELYKASGVP
jgi:hypothetical protein